MHIRNLRGTHVVHEDDVAIPQRRPTPSTCSTYARKDRPAMTPRARNAPARCRRAGRQLASASASRRTAPSRPSDGPAARGRRRRRHLRRHCRLVDQRRERDGCSAGCYVFRSACRSDIRSSLLSHMQGCFERGLVAVVEAPDRAGRVKTASLFLAAWPIRICLKRQMRIVRRGGRPALVPRSTR